MSSNKRITKALAESTAEKLCDKFEKEIEICKSNLSKYVTGALKSKVSKEVFDFYKKNPGYINCINQFSLGKDFSWTRVSLTEPIPSNVAEELELTKAEYKEANKLLKAIDKAKVDFKQTKKEIISALIALRTYKRVESDFPEAFKILPPASQVLLPSVNLKNLRDKL